MNLLTVTQSSSPCFFLYCCKKIMLFNARKHIFCPSFSLLSVGENLDALKKSLLWLMFWPSSSTVSFNTRLRELFKLTWSACDDPNQVSDKDKCFDSTGICWTEWTEWVSAWVFLKGKGAYGWTCQFQNVRPYTLYIFKLNIIFLFQVFLVQSLQSVVSMASECYILTDLVSFKCDEVGLGSRLSERSRTFVTELAYGGTHHEASMNCFLETCSPWLQMHIAEILLANYTDLSVPFEKRHLKSKTLSLEKIVSNATLTQSVTKSNKKILYIRDSVHLW